jgi:hypothetical protein
MAEIQYDEGDWSKLSQLEREKFIYRLMNQRVDRRCEVCGFYAVRRQDMIAHAGTSKHGFVDRGIVLQMITTQPIKEGISVEELVEKSRKEFNEWQEKIMCEMNLDRKFVMQNIYTFENILVRNLFGEEE